MSCTPHDKWYGRVTQFHTTTQYSNIFPWRTSMQYNRNLTWANAFNTPLLTGFWKPTVAGLYFKPDMNGRMWKLGPHAEHQSSWLNMSDIWARWIMSYSWASLFWKSITIKSWKRQAELMIPARLMGVSFSQKYGKTWRQYVNRKCCSICHGLPWFFLENMNAMLVTSQVGRHLWTPECQISLWAVANKQTNRWNITSSQLSGW